MQAVDFRNSSWSEIQGKITGLRSAVYSAWHTHGPGTTREISARVNIDILTFRPRTTELLQLGLLEVDPTADSHGHQGIYRAVPINLARRRHLFAQQPSQLALL